MKDRKGFSLIELLAILIIIGLILIVAIPAISRLLKSNNTKQYEKYLEVVRAGALVYADSRKDDLGGSNDTGCVDTDDYDEPLLIEYLIKNGYIKSYSEKDITCTGKVRLNNNKGNVSASINLTCKNNRNVTTFEVNEITNDTCVPYIPVDVNNKTLASQILLDNVKKSDTNIDFSSISSDTNGKGLYYTRKNTENSRIVYYFRGNVENNYVQFGKDSSGNDIVWRIVRINEDGSIRIVTQEALGESEFNKNHTDNAYVGYMYGTAGSSTYALTHANDNPSTIKTYLDNWYINNLSNYSSYLIDAGFCNDRSIAMEAGLWNFADTALGYGTNDTFYGSFNRLHSKKTQFACPNGSNDLFTTNNSSKGNKKLVYPVGLLTADEVVYAGGVLFQTNASMYLTNGSDYWTMSSSRFSSSALVLNSDENGYFRLNNVINKMGVRPVVNLKASVEVTNETQNGSKTNPYIIKTNN